MGRAQLALTSSHGRMMADFFFYGTLCHLPLLEIVLGRPVAPQAVRLPDHAVHWAKDQPFPLISECPGAVAEGVFLPGLSAEDAARLDFYEGGFAYHTRDLALEDGRLARVYFPDPGHWSPGAPWSLAEWVAARSAVVTETARDFMALFGKQAADQVLKRYPMMLVRGASRLRAAVPTPPGLRRLPAPDDVEILAHRQPYAHFFALEEYDLRHRRFDGAASPVIERAAFISGDAATVLPYDPVRDRVLVVEQLRIGPMARGDSNPWLLEAVAGRIDPFETPEDCARREAEEEAGIALTELIKVAGYYPSPGAKSEFLYSFVALCDLPDLAPRHGGLAAEAEDIRAHVIPFDRLMQAITAPEGANAPLILTAYWLAANRARLRAEAG